MKIKYIVTLSLTVTLIAQSAAETLKHVAQETLINNPEIQALRKNTKAYRKYVDEEEGGYYPTLSLDTYFEEKETLQSGEKTRQNGVNTQLKLEQTLFDGGLTSSKVSEANANFRSNKIKNVAQIETIIQETIEAYINVVKNEELTLLSKNNLEIHEDYLIVAQQSEDVSGDSLDRMQVESKLFSAKAKYVKLQNDRNEAKANLVKFYGKEMKGQICRPSIDPMRISSDLEKTITDAVASNYTILESLEDIKSQRSLLSQEQSRFFPTIKARVLREVDDGIDVKNIKKTEDTIRLSLSYNLFNGFKDKAIYERERLFLQESQKNLDDVVNTVKEEVKINFSKYHTSKDRIKFLKEYLEKNKNILQVYLEQFEGGTRSFIDILNHEAEIFRAKTELVEEEFSYYSSYFAILALQSRLSEAVIDNADQVCKPIKVDIEKRELRSKDENIDEDLTNLFNDNLPESAQEVVDSKQQQEAEVQSILSQILDEIYNPDAKNKNISVSSQGLKAKEERYISTPKSKKVTETNPVESATEKLIKQRQLEEEKALREETESLKEQIKHETEKLLGDEEVPQSGKTEIAKKEEVIEPLEAAVQDNKKEIVKPKKVEKSSLTSKKPKVKTEIEKLLEERERLRKLAQKIQKEVTTTSETVGKKKKPWDEMTLKEQQVESRRLGEEIRRKYREKIAKEEQLKVEKLQNEHANIAKVQAQKEKELRAQEKEESIRKAAKLKNEQEKKVSQAKKEAELKAQEVKAKKEKALQEEKLQQEKEKAEVLEKAQKEKEAQRIKEEAIKKAKALAQERKEVLEKAATQKKKEETRIKALEKEREDAIKKAAQEREEKLRKELQEAKRLEKEEQDKAELIKRKEEEEAEKQEKAEAEKKRQEAMEKELVEREKAKALVKQKAQEKKAILQRKEEEEADKLKQETIEKKRQEAIALAQQEREKAQAIAKKREEEEKARLEKQKVQEKQKEEALKQATLLKQQEESRRIAAEIRRKFREKIAQEEALKKEQELKAKQAKAATELKARQEEEAKAVAEALRIEKVKEEAAKAQKQKEAAIKKAKVIKAEQDAKRAKEKAENIVEEMQKAKILKEQEEAQIAQIKKEQEEAQLRLRQEAQLQEERDKAQKEKDTAARAKAKAIIEELRRQDSVEEKNIQNIEKIDDRQIQTVDDTVSKAQKIVDDIKRKKEEENQQTKAQELASTMKNKEAINPLKDGNYFKTQKLKKQDDARDKAKAIVDEIRQNQASVSGESQDAAAKAKAIVESIKMNKNKPSEQNEAQRSTQVVSKAKALVQEIKSQSPQKEDSVKKAQDLISDIKAKKENEIKEYRFNEDKTLAKEDSYISLKKEFTNPQSKKYTISILTLDSNGNIGALQKRYGLNEDVVSYKLMSNNKEYFKIIYGVFNTREEAFKAIEGLHPKLQDNKPFVDRISKHQKLYMKYNK